MSDANYDTAAVRDVPVEDQSAELGYSEDGDMVTLRITRGDYELMLLLFGAVTGCLYGPGDDPMDGMWTRIVGLVDRLNKGNPNYRPYAIPEV